MAEVTLTIGDRRHVVTCRAGGEDQLRRVGAMLDERWAAASRATGGSNAERTMLLIALMLADALDEARHHPPDDVDGDLLGKLADRLETLADSLEN